MPTLTDNWPETASYKLSWQASKLSFSHQVLACKLSFVGLSPVGRVSYFIRDLKWPTTSQMNALGRQANERWPKEGKVLYLRGVTYA